ncbi:MAG: zinc ribbon domain-containing protein, partial [Clostridia bacterium]
MSKTNNFNVCPRCGTANALSAKFCFQCGSELRVPDEPIVCPKCNTVNTSMANFCKTCGANLRTNAQTRVCPRCGNVVDIGEAFCDKCNYAFNNVSGAVAPRTVGTSTSHGASGHMQMVKGGEKIKDKGARGIAIVSLLLLLVMAYALVLPYGKAIVPSFVTVTVAPTAYTALEYAMSLVTRFTDGGISAINVTDYILGGMIALTVLCMVAHLISAIVRLFTAKRAKSANWFYFVMFCITGLATLTLFLSQLAVATPWGEAGNFLRTLSDFFASLNVDGKYSLGWQAWVPVA